MKNLKNFGEPTRIVRGEGYKVEKLDVTALETAGINNGMGLRVGDEITFPETDEELNVQSVNTEKGNFERKVITVDVLKNGKRTNVSLGSFRQFDKNGDPSCKLAGEIRDNYTTDLERVRALRGKTIVCAAKVDMECYKFGTRDVEIRPLNVIEYAEPKLNAEYFTK